MSSQLGPVLQYKQSLHQGLKNIYSELQKNMVSGSNLRTSVAPECRDRGGQVRGMLCKNFKVLII